MDKSYYDVILEITPPEQLEKACQMVNRQNVIPGFRKGKAPSARIIALSQSTPLFQKNISPFQQCQNRC